MTLSASAWRMSENISYPTYANITDSFGSSQRTSVFGRGLYSGEKRPYFNVRFRYVSFRASGSYGEN